MSESDKISEQISALLDDELNDREAETTLTRLRDRDELQQTWERYHLIGDVMRGERIHAEISQTAARVQAQVAQEPAIIAAPQQKGTRPQESTRWLRMAAGAGLAASVAAVAVVTMPYLTGSGIDGGAEPFVVAERQAQPPVQYARSSGTRWKNLSQPAIESKLNGYLVEHSEYASPGGVGGVIPYATYVSYDVDR
jgi:sigma-E factor negative regulatory protein RseA